MRKVFVFGLFVLGLWAAAEVQQSGIEGAFGGAFGGESASAEATLTTGARTADAFQRAYDRSESRVDDLLAQPGHAE